MKSLDKIIISVSTKASLPTTAMPYHHHSQFNASARVLTISIFASALSQGAVSLHNLADEALFVNGSTVAISQPFIGATPAVTINGGLFQRNATNSGSGTFRDLVRFDGSSNNDQTGQDAYNRDTDRVLDDSFIGQENGVVRVSDMIRDASDFYYVFRLDINNEGFTSIDQIKIWNSSQDLPTDGTAPNSLVALQTQLGITNDEAPIYDFDGGVDDNTIFLNSDDSPGSGSSDLAIFIPQSVFGASTDFVYFYIQMNGYDESGGLTDVNLDAIDISANKGNHESVALPIIDQNDPEFVVAIPEPSSLALIGLSLLGLTFRKRRS